MQTITIIIRDNLTLNAVANAVTHAHVVTMIIIVSVSAVILNHADGLEALRIVSNLDSKLLLMDVNPVVKPLAVDANLVVRGWHDKCYPSTTAAVPYNLTI